MANRDQHRSMRRRSSPDYRSTHTSGVNSSADLAACSGTSPDVLKRSTRLEAGSVNTAITFRNKHGISYRLDNSSNSPFGFACVSKSAETIGAVTQGRAPINISTKVIALFTRLSLAKTPI